MSVWLIAAWLVLPAQGGISHLPYNNPGLVVDLGAGLWAWPLPLDWDNDEDLDLLVSSPDRPNNATFLFENRGPAGESHPVFEPPVRVGPGYQDIRVSYVDGSPRLLVRGNELVEFRMNGLIKKVAIHPTPDFHQSTGNVRSRLWHLVDFDGDEALDLVVGIGDWSDYGWDDAYDAEGKWTRGPLHGFVYVIRNTGTTESPQYAAPVKLEAGGAPIDVYGRPCPNLADFDGDGDLDLLCGEFLDGFTYFQNEGTRKRPAYVAGQRLSSATGEPLRMDLEMIAPVAIDWDGDGDMDLIVGDEDGRVALVEHTGRVEAGLPVFEPPYYFQQRAQDLKFGALATPCAADWDGDGDTDLVCGNSAGYLGWFENQGGDGSSPTWAAPRFLEADGDVIRIMAGPNGSIQGPAEAKWGYTVPEVADWDMDGDLDILVNSIWGRIEWFENVGTREEPALKARGGVQVRWDGAVPKPAWTWWKPLGNELVTQWRTSPRVRDVNGDGLPDLVVLDPEGFLALYERARGEDGRLVLLPGKRHFSTDGPSAFESNHGVRDPGAGLLRLNVNRAGGSGRRQWCFTDWDEDGRLDLLVNSRSISLMRNMGEAAHSWRFHDAGALSECAIGSHATCPTVAQFGEGKPATLIVGAEDGFLYVLDRTEP